MSVFSAGRWRVSWMATLSILRFCTAGGAKVALGDVWALVDSGRLTPRDRAIMSWDPSRAMSDTCQAVPDRRDAQRQVRAVCDAFHPAQQQEGSAPYPGMEEEDDDSL